MELHKGTKVESHPTERDMDSFLKKLLLTVTGAALLAVGAGVLTLIQMNSAQAGMQKDISENTVTVKSNEIAVIEIKTNQVHMAAEIKDTKLEVNKNRDLLLEVLREVKK